MGSSLSAREKRVRKLLEEIYWRKRDALPEQLVERCPACNHGTFQWAHRASEDFREGYAVTVHSYMWCDHCYLPFWGVLVDNYVKVEDVPEELARLVEESRGEKIPSGKMNSKGKHSWSSFTP